MYAHHHNQCRRLPSITLDVDWTLSQITGQISGVILKVSTDLRSTFEGIREKHSAHGMTDWMKT